MFLVLKAHRLVAIHFPLKAHLKARSECESSEVPSEVLIWCERLQVMMGNHKNQWRAQLLGQLHPSGALAKWLSLRPEVWGEAPGLPGSFHSLLFLEETAVKCAHENRSVSIENPSLRF